jgi:hypothetical protein
MACGQTSLSIEIFTDDGTLASNMTIYQNSTGTVFNGGGSYYGFSPILVML